MANTPINLEVRRRKTSKQRPLTEIKINSLWSKPAIVADAADRDTTEDDYTYSDAMAFGMLQVRLNRALKSAGIPLRVRDLEVE